jgi:hypothetical protein
MMSDLGSHGANVFRVTSISDIDVGYLRDGDKSQVAPRTSRRSARFSR